MPAVDKKISYEIIRSRRKTTDIVIERDGRIVVRAPEGMDDGQIKRIVASKKYWMYRNLAEWRDLNSTRILREYKNGEGFLYLGRAYRLLLVSEQKEPLYLKNGRFCLRRDLVEGSNIDAAKDAFQAYYSHRGLEKIGSRVDIYSPRIGVDINEIEVRHTGNLWASCSRKGKRVAFHWKCMMAPLSIIDYIVVHELCHFLHQHHTEAFWNEVDKIIPNYRERKEWLRLNGAALDI